MISVIALICAVKSSAAPVTDENCEKSLVEAPEAANNRNGHIALEDYKQTNDRTYYAYEGHLGSLFKKRMPTDSWLDSGAGYGLAALDALTEGKVGRAVVVNAQDALAPLRARDFAWFRAHAGNFKTGRIVSFCGHGLFDRAMVDPERGAWMPNAIEILVEGGAHKLQELESSGKFKYAVGFAENVLPQMSSKFSFITDLFGAYFYSAARADLLRAYYDRLLPGGNALIVYHGQDHHRQYNSESRTHDVSIDDYGPETVVHRIDGRIQTFEHYLVEVFPTVFSLETSNAEERYPTSRHGVLVMKHDPKIVALNLLKHLHIKSVQYGREGIASQVPSVVYQEMLN